MIWLALQWWATFVVWVWLASAFVVARWVARGGVGRLVWRVQNGDNGRLSRFRRLVTGRG